MARIKAPAARGFTLAERRSITFEKVSLYMVFLVSVVAFVFSFVALTWVGNQFSDPRFGWMLPVTIDGIGIACSVGVIRSVSEGHSITRRLSEWFGMLAAVALSIMGNVHHGLSVSAGRLPDYMVITYSAAIPIIVAFGIHIYGRAMTNGISAHVMADDPDKLQFGITHLNDVETVAAHAAPTRVTRTAPRQTEARTAVAEARASAPAKTAPAAAPSSAPAPEPVASPEDVVFEQYAAARRAGDQWTGKQVGLALGFTEGAGRKVRQRWDAMLASELDAVVPPTDRGAVDLETARSDRERATA